MGLWSGVVNRSVTGEERLGDTELNFGVLDSIRVFINRTISHKYDKEHDWCTFKIEGKNTIRWTICGFKIPFKVPEDGDMQYVFRQLMSRIKVFTDRSTYMNTLYKTMERNYKEFCEFQHIKEEDDYERLLDWK